MDDSRRGPTFHIAGPLVSKQAWGYACSVHGLEGPSRIYVGKGRAIRSAVLQDSGSEIESSSFSLGESTVQILTKRGESGAQTLFVWEGPHHELYAAVGGTGVEPERIAEYLGRLDITDEPNGLRTSPVGLGRVELELAATLARGIGSINVTPIAKGAVPQVRGRQSSAGEVWSWKEDGINRLTVASSSAVTTITQVDDGREVGDFVENARVDLTSS